MNGVRGSRGKQKREQKETHHISTSQRVVEVGKYYECFEVERDHSLTAQQYMRLLYGQTLLRRGKPCNSLPTFIRRGRKRRTVEQG